MSVTITVGNIEYPNTTSNVTIEFSNTITDLEINSFITNEPSNGSTLSTLVSSDGGKTWTGTLTGSDGYVVKGATMSINYTGGINGSDSYNIVMIEGGKEFIETFNITDGVNSYTGHSGISCNKAGTIFALDRDQENYDAVNEVYPRVEVYEYDGTNWNRKGGDLAVSTSGMRVLMIKLNETGDHIIINSTNNSDNFTIVYKWDGSSWVQKGSTLNHSIWGRRPEITSDGNMIGLNVLEEPKAYIYEYDTNTSDWVLKGQALEITTGSNRGIGRMMISSDKTRVSLAVYESSPGINILTYLWNNETSMWNLTETLNYEGFHTKGLVGNYGGNRIAIADTGEHGNTPGVYVYEWNGTSHVQVGSEIQITTITEVALNGEGNKVAIVENSTPKRTKIYSYDGSSWNLSKTIEYGINVAINGSGDKIFMVDGYSDKSLSIYEDEIIKRLNEMSLSPSEVKFPETTSELRLEFSHNDLTSTEVGTNVSISDVNLGSLGVFTSSEGGYVWKSTFTGANIEGSGTIDYTYSGMTGSVALIVDTLEKAISNICFRGEAKVLTSEGYMEIREVKKGMKVGGEEIEEITRTISKEKEVVLMKKGSIMKNMPREDTVITKEHKVLYKGRMVEAKELVNGRTIVYEKYKGETLYNILLSGEGKMVVNGMIVETLSPSNNIAKLYKMLKGYKEEEKREIIKIYNEERKERNGKKQMK